MKKKETNQRVFIQNRKARYEYEFLETFLAGISLLGSEIKSIRMSKSSIVEAFCYIHNGEIFIKNMYVAKYEFANVQNHEERRVRKLLLKKKEINKLFKSKDKGLTIIPTKVFINGKGLAKVEIALAKGKKLYDKRQTLKERSIEKRLREVK